MEMDGRNVVLVGVGRAGQLGEAVAGAFAARGARLFLADRHGAEARARAARVETDGGRAMAFETDPTDAAAVAALARAVGDATGGRVDAVVHLAGGFLMTGPVAESDAAAWPASFGLHATSAYLVARAFIPLLRPAHGALVFFASEAVLPGGRSAGISAYAAAKGAVVALMRAIAEEEAVHGVRANAHAPATIRTAANEAAMPAGTRMVSREAVADAVLWLSGESARAVTGQVVAVR
jgi:NAD(P)-dependent dehydrogenase (short-subunit alcohol dehydrogenase family)